LAQNDGRCRGKSQYTTCIGIYVWDLTDPRQKITQRGSKSHHTPTFINSRESCCSMTLEKGFYCLMPCTFNPGDFAQFYFTVYSDKNVKCGVIGKSIFIFD
jgi:hypothetical protein